LEAFTGVLVSPMLPQREQTNMCEMACSVATRADLDHAIGMLQASQIGEAKCSIDCLSLSMERQFPEGNVLAPHSELGHSRIQISTLGVRLD
jgi:hypothetical protein